MQHKIGRWLLLACLLLAGAAGTRSAEAQSAGVPTVAILAPAKGATITDNRIVLTLRHSNFAYNAPAANQGAKPGEGHYRVFVDDQLAGLGYSDAISLPNDLLPQIGAGPHTLRVALYDGANNPVAGAQGDSTPITIAQPLSYAAAAGSPNIALVGDPKPDGNGHYQITTRITGFTVDSTKINLTEEPGRGHYHTYLDGVLVGVGESEVSAIPSALNPQVVTPGQHKLKVILETHQHREIPGQTIVERTVTLDAAVLQQSAPQPTVVMNMPGMTTQATQPAYTYPGPAPTNVAPAPATWQVGGAAGMVVLALLLIGSVAYLVIRAARPKRRAADVVEMPQPAEKETTGSALG